MAHMPSAGMIAGTGLRSMMYLMGGCFVPFIVADAVGRSPAMAGRAVVITS